MNKERKTLKEYSIVILALAAFSLVRTLVEFFVDGFDVSNIVSGAGSEQLVKIVTIVVFAIALLLLIPNVFIGVRGLKEANNPTGKKGHVVWALVLAIISAIATIIAVVDVVMGFNTSKLLDAIDVAVDVALFIAYYLVAKKVANNK